MLLLKNDTCTYLQKLLHTKVKKYCKGPIIKILRYYGGHFQPFLLPQFLFHLTIFTMSTHASFHVFAWAYKQKNKHKLLWVVRLQVLWCELLLTCAMCLFSHDAVTLLPYSPTISINFLLFPYFYAPCTLSVLLV